ncbi:MFS transporter [Krasilnikovia cinnamomea]|uniref:MFS transporter n=1 Tax=Krasilnikovia cinnamomea TaxID=349313 RepID=A0A4Q7ZP76_9ACTN|nr:MFS transporter [Krasilnikovia cinnamomea]
MYVSVRDRPAAAGGAAGRVATTVLLLGVVSLLTDISSEMVAAVLPLYLTAQAGLGYLGYGLVDGAYQGVSALVRMVGGYAGDRSDRAKWIAVIGYGVSALSRIALLPAHGLAAITAVITADRLGKGLRTAPRDALIAAASPPHALGRAFGVHRMLDTIGAALGPLVAFLLLAAVPQGYNAVFVVAFAVAAVGLAVLVLLVPDRRTNRGTRVRLGDILREVTGARLRRPLLACALLGAVTIGDGFLYLVLQQQDELDVRWFPLLFVGTNVAYLLLALPLGRLADRVGRARVLLAGHVALLAVYLVAAGPVRGPVTIVAVLALLGTFYAATDGVLPALVSRLVSAETRTSGIAAAQTVTVVARFASSVAFGALWSAVGARPGLLAFALLLAAALPVAAVLLRGAGRTPLPSGAAAASPEPAGSP